MRDTWIEYEHTMPEMRLVGKNVPSSETRGNPGFAFQQHPSPIKLVAISARKTENGVSLHDRLTACFHSDSEWHRIQERASEPESLTS
jgi:hypothetical protein